MPADVWRPGRRARRPGRGREPQARCGPPTAQGSHAPPGHAGDRQTARTGRPTEPKEQRHEQSQSTHRSGARRATRRTARTRKPRSRGVRSSTGWQRWLSTRRHFHHYSLRNQLLIAMQAPDSTRVAGFRAWLQLGYAVRKGETAIKIWMPLAPSRKQLQAWRDGGGDPGEKPRTLFKLGSVFDVSQVSPLPPPANPAPLDPPIARLEGDELAHLHAPLEQFANRSATASRSRHSTDPKASARTASRKSRSRNRSKRTAGSRRCCTSWPTRSSASTAARRPQAHLRGRGTRRRVGRLQRAGVAGIDTSTNSVPYLTAWSEKTPIETIHAHAELIDRLARRLEEVIANHGATVEEEATTTA